MKMKLKVYKSHPDMYTLGIAFGKDNKSIAFGVCFFRIAVIFEIVW